MVDFGNDWDRVLAGEFEKDYYLRLRQFLIKEYGSGTVYPNMYDIFNAMKMTPYGKVKVVILGQDPYHEPGQAHGLAFSVKEGVRRPPSLNNIFKELQDDLGIELPADGSGCPDSRAGSGCLDSRAGSGRPDSRAGSGCLDNRAGSGCLDSWAREGVLLLNTVLTVRAHEANSHRGRGWEQLTDRMIQKLSDRDRPMVFMLWGASAKAKAALIDPSRHLILKGAHPSPLSAHNGFFGGRYFSKANEFLTGIGEEPVDWQL